MAESRPLYLGPRLKRLRRELGLTQQAMAEDLDISPSYVALLERNQRPLTADLLLRLAKSYRIDVADLDSEDSDEYARRLSDMLRDPIFSDIDLPPLEVADVASNFPAVSEALLRLYRAYLGEQQALAGQHRAGDSADDPAEEVRHFLSSHSNHFPDIEARAEALADEITAAGGAETWLAAKGTRVRFLPGEVMMGAVRRHDRHNSQLLLNDGLKAESRTFQIALHIAYTAIRSEISGLIRDHTFGSEAAKTLTRRGLASYAAAAIVMPYGRFSAAVTARSYDIIALSRLFGTSFEQTAHRLTTLCRPGSEAIPFFFLRIDAAGNVSKRLNGADFAYPVHDGGCPQWQLQAAFSAPETIHSQWLEMPDGQRFFALARAVQAGGLGHDSPVAWRVVALVCRAEHAPAIIHSDGVDPAKVAATPIGVTCRLCHRANCTARAAPAIGRELLSDDTRRGVEPFLFAED